MYTAFILGVFHIVALELQAENSNFRAFKMQ
jgi:hypothetical protein